MAGFPCQPFSRTGKGGGFPDPRGTVFWGCASYIEAQAPKAWVLENVAGLISHDSGRTMDAVLQTLGDIHIQCAVLNTMDHGTPE